MNPEPPSSLVICNCSDLTSRLRPVLARLAPGCRLLYAPAEATRAWPAAHPEMFGRMREALLETTEALERTRHAFKSRELGQLRRRLQELLDELGASGQ